MTEIAKSQNASTQFLCTEGGMTRSNAPSITSPDARVVTAIGLDLTFIDWFIWSGMAKSLQRNGNSFRSIRTCTISIYNRQSRVRKRTAQAINTHVLVRRLLSRSIIYFNNR